MNIKEMLVLCQYENHLKAFGEIKRLEILAS